MKYNIKRGLIYFVIILIMIFISLFIINIFSNSEKELIDLNKQVLLPNEYDIIDISETDIIRNYINSFISRVVANNEDAYSLLCSNNKEKFNYDKYVEYMKKATNNFTEVPLPKYYKIVKKNKKILYYIKTENDYKFLFITDDIINYKVQLDVDIDDIIN